MLILDRWYCDVVGTVNSMVDQLSAFASEVTRVALEVGTQGILGGQAKVEGVQGTWADLTRNVNVRLFNLFLVAHMYAKPVSEFVTNMC